MLPEIKIHTTMKGTRYALFAQQEIISDEIRKTGYWNVYNLEIADIILQRNRGKKNLRVLDVGAGQGSFTIPLAEKYNNYLFDSFEPVPALNSQLNTNVLLNRLYNVRCHRNGLSDKTEIIDHFIFDLSSINHGSFALFTDSYVKRGIPIPNEVDVYDLRRLDDYRFGQVELIKITVSGMELEVLRGAVKTIEQNKNPPLMIECWNADWYADRKKEMLDLVKQYGYKQILLRRDFIFALNDFDLMKAIEKRINEQIPGTLVMFK